MCYVISIHISIKNVNLKFVLHENEKKKDDAKYPVYFQLQHVHIIAG